METGRSGWLGTDGCVRCGSGSDARLVTYVRRGQTFTEIWCRACREERLVRREDMEPSRRRRLPGGGLWRRSSRSTARGG
jgi:hypothetical protein